MFVKSAILEILSRFLTFAQLRRISEKKLEKIEAFQFKGLKYPYFYHSYNNSMITERCVEIPLVQRVVRSKSWANVLEIGNVTKHYYELFNGFGRKVTLDKYEIAYDVVNVDIMDYCLNDREQYDLIYSISTFEHMDSDGGRNAQQPKKGSGVFGSVAFENVLLVLTRLLCSGGTFMLTFPMGYMSREIDADILSGAYKKIPCTAVDIGFLQQRADESWEEVPDSGTAVCEKADWNRQKMICVLTYVK